MAKSLSRRKPATWNIYKFHSKAVCLDLMAFAIFCWMASSKPPPTDSTADEQKAASFTAKSAVSAADVDRFTGEPLNGDVRCGDCRPFWIGHQPSPDKYRELIASLSAIEFARKSGQYGQHQLSLAVSALTSILEYLYADPMVFRLHLTAILGLLRSALHDTCNGARPKLLFEQGRSPTHLTRAVLRAQIVLMFRILTRDTGDDPIAASRWLGSRLVEAGICDRGKPIEPAQIRRWNGEKGGKSISGSDQAYEVIERKFLKRRKWPTGLAVARRLVCDLISKTKATGFF
jgi:hypothetical protein